MWSRTSGAFTGSFPGKILLVSMMAAIRSCIRQDRCILRWCGVPPSYARSCVSGNDGYLAQPADVPSGLPRILEIARVSYLLAIPSWAPDRAPTTPRGAKPGLKCTCAYEARVLAIVERLVIATFASVSAPGFQFDRADFHQTEPHSFHVFGVSQRYLLNGNNEMPSFVTRGKSSELCVFCRETGVVFCSDSSHGICLDENLIMAPSPLATRTFPQGKAQLQSRLCQRQVGVI